MRCAVLRAPARSAVRSRVGGCAGLRPPRRRLGAPTRGGSPRAPRVRPTLRALEDDALGGCATPGMCSALQAAERGVWGWGGGGVHPVPQPRGAHPVPHCAALGPLAGPPIPAVPGAALAAGWCQAGGRTPCAVPDPRPQGCTAPGLGTATLAPAQAQHFVAGWTVVLRDVTAQGRSQGTAEVYSCGAEAVSSAQHLPADEQLGSSQAGMPSPQSKCSLAPESGPDPTVPREEPRVPPSYAERC